MLHCWVSLWSKSTRN